MAHGALSISQRARGCVIAHMIADALGAPVEGFNQESIRTLANKHFGGKYIEGFIPGVPMGTFVPGAEPATYREARLVSDAMSFVRTGPSDNENVKRQCERVGMYTDDTNACLAIGASIVACGQVNAEHAAKTSAEFFRDNEAYRGCPPTAKKVMYNVLDGVSIEETGLPPHFPFAGGSFANGGAMRISLLAIPYRDASPAVIRQSVTAAIMSSHRHPEAIDFAVVQASAVQYALCQSTESFDSARLLAELQERCETDAMKQVIRSVAETLAGCEGDEDVNDLQLVQPLVDAVPRPGSGMSFQIASVHMVPCVLYCVCRYYRQPQLACQVAIDFGGDTDTTAAMVGAVMGALHGEDWCQHWIEGLENGPHGRDYSFSLAEQLAKLSVCNSTV